MLRGPSVAMTAIEAVNVTKIYRRYARKRQFATLKSALLKGSLIRDLQPDETFPALRGVSFTVPKGCTYGIIGRNGSGKSTLLKCVAGITRPNEGTVKVDGRISALIELGAGFHPEISGRENVFINGIMLGLSRREIQRRFDEIVEFAELQDFIDAPVKTYSSGMYMRLGFAVAIHVDPDVLLIDEVLAVGDQAFTVKCLDKFAEFRRRNKTILLVTHSLDLVERFCDRALWLDKGKTLAEGEPRRVVASYLHRRRRRRRKRSSRRMKRPWWRKSRADCGRRSRRRLNMPSDVVNTPADMFQATEGRWGSREVEITEVTLLGATATPGHVFQSGDAVEIRLKTRAHAATKDFVFGIGLFNADGVCCYGTNTNIEELEPSEMSGDGEIRFQYCEPGAGRGHLQDRCRGAQAGRLPVRLSPAALHVSREVANQGRRHLPARAPLAVLAEHPVQGARHSNDERRTHTEGLDATRRTSERHGASRDEAIGWVRDAARRQRHDRLHQRRLRSPASGPRAVSARGAALGDALIVAVNSDRSARALEKGPDRPINTDAERAEVLAALACVDAVVIFDEDTPLEIVRALQPDVLVKGADWAAGHHRRRRCRRSAAAAGSCASRWPRDTRRVGWSRRSEASRAGQAGRSVWSLNSGSLRDSSPGPSLRTTNVHSDVPFGSRAPQ